MNNKDWCDDMTDLLWKVEGGEISFRIARQVVIAMAETDERMSAVLSMRGISND